MNVSQSAWARIDEAQLDVVTAVAPERRRDGRVEHQIATSLRRLTNRRSAEDKEFDDEM